MNFISRSTSIILFNDFRMQSRRSTIRRFSAACDLKRYNLKFTNLVKSFFTRNYGSMGFENRNVLLRCRSYVGGAEKVVHCPTRSFFCSKLYQNNSVLDVNTNVIKDIILFRYENPQFFRIVNVFAICQFAFWSYLSHFAFTTLKDTPLDKENLSELPWWRKINLGDNKYRNGITFLCFAIGYGILVAAWAFTLRSVRFLVLRKGGQSVTFVTYGPFGKNRMITVPIDKVSCQEGRQAARVQLPIKVKNSALYYVLDMRGEFTNPRLFDHTAGLKRVFKD